MKIIITGEGRFFRGFCENMKEKKEEIDAILYEKVLTFLGFPRVEEIPRGAIAISLQEGFICGTKILDLNAGITEPKTTIYVELVGVTDTLNRSGEREKVLDGLIQFVKTFYKSTDYSHDSVQIKPEILFISPSMLFEKKANYGVIAEEL